MNIAIDVILAAIFLACVIASAKKGIIRTVLEIVAFLAAIVLAFQLAAPFARTCYNTFLSSRVEERIYEQLPGDGSGITYSNQAQAVLEALPDFYSNQAQAVLEALPDFAKTYLEKSGEGDSFLQQVVSGNYSGKDAAKQLNEQIAAPVCETILTSVFFLLLSLVFSAVLSWLAKLISKGFKVPVPRAFSVFVNGEYEADGNEKHGTLNGYLFEDEVHNKYRVYPQKDKKGEEIPFTATGQRADLSGVLEAYENGGPNMAMAGGLWSLYGVYYWTCIENNGASSFSFVIRNDEQKSTASYYTIGFIGAKTMARPVRCILDK